MLRPLPPPQRTAPGSYNDLHQRRCSPVASYRLVLPQLCPVPTPQLKPKRSSNCDVGGVASLSLTGCTVAERHHRITPRAVVVDKPASDMPVAKANCMFKSSSLVRPHQFPIDGTRT